MYRKLLHLLKAFRQRSASNSRISTSLSDNQRYPQACLNAANDYETFNNFRRNPAYTEILEHVTPELGARYLEGITDDSILSALPDIRLNDLCGNPLLTDYPKIGKFSPTTLRYAKVMQDLKRQIGSLDNLKICEIGVGYGGQCRVISSLNKPFKYTLVDLKPALQLAQRYLDNYALQTQLEFLTMNECPFLSEIDLVISNYAFTELPRSIQDIYLSKIITRAKHGYITYNEITPPEFSSYTQVELLKIIPGSKVMAEVPLTHEKNCIIAW